MKSVVIPGLQEEVAFDEMENFKQNTLDQLSTIDDNVQGKQGESQKNNQADQKIEVLEYKEDEEEEKKNQED